MPSVQILGPKPRPDALYAVEQQRKQREQRALKLETRAAQGNSKSCPGCGFGGYNGTHCSACDYPAGGTNGHHIDTGLMTEMNLRYRPSKCAHCGGQWPQDIGDPPCCRVSLQYLQAFNAERH
jgi:hypothetical protein